MAGGVLWLFVLGFVLFAARVGRIADERNAQADGIVVLTGGPTRIAEAARLLKDKRGRRLLISGINPHTNRDSLQKLAQLSPAEFECCVDLDYAAQDTIGNAQETRKWVLLHRYDRVIVVTSRFHMPRSLLEMGRALPGVELIAHPVTAGSGKQPPWWLSVSTTRVIVSEYVKFLPAAARYLAARTFGSWESSHVAGSSEPSHAKTSGL
jgi:uncharacterized SAM-binding protein YcdF (DUF218 family)